MVMERIFATKISHIETLKKNNVNLEKLAAHGVTIFFTQLLRDNFFHADMHPGNLFVDITNPQEPVYVGVDFGIMGQLSDTDQTYIAENFLAFFKRDYREVARLHIESGWVPSHVRIDQFESAIRAIAEPIFQKPLSEISFGLSLLKLIQVAREYQMPVQPQLMQLQKTLIGIEALGRNLYPDLDLWATAQPLLEKWVREKKSPKHLFKKICGQWRENLDCLIDLPVNLNRYLNNPVPAPIVETPKKQHRNLLFLTGALTTLAGIVSLCYQVHQAPIILSVGLALIIVERVSA